ncbi:uncharacterized protein EDB91DRAFT_1337292 [Suillus paluster]|uniref:uncharacterized protein n=1 Tax=Suillus paluster TaxID=48578 RepID=UPI001B882874|nr:uncharacterized protein EDB91DRAFT_1337292 [Suillus paluster]KAG1737103.1 hypothetical protein EDB91DRAFT_1337292 [Suillus paluster]
MYFIYYHHHDSYPESLGIMMLQSMRSPHTITSQQQELKEILDQWDGSQPQELDEDVPIISSERPRYGRMIGEWVYEIDLDHNIFHVNGVPFYSLECLPDNECFLEDISEDHYGKFACHPEYPPQHKYKKPAPPVVNDPDLAIDVLSPDEQVRVALLEIMVGQCIANLDTVAELIYEFNISPYNQLPDSGLSVAYAMASFAFLPQIFDSESGFVRHSERLRREKFISWVRKDTIVCITTHLDGERCFQASVSRLINAILEQRDVPGDYFGIAFSIAHCAIVKVAKRAHKTTFSHTPTLQFLPSFYADSPSTPGITALARLGYRIDPALFVRAMDVYHGPWGLWVSRRRRGIVIPSTMGRGMVSDECRTDHEKSCAEGANDTPPSIRCAVLPPELWREIALHLDLQDIFTLGLVSKLCRHTASTVLRYPHVCGYRLVAVSKETPDWLLHHHRSLTAASFSASFAGIPTTLLVGRRDKSEEHMAIPLDISSLKDFYPRFEHIVFCKQTWFNTLAANHCESKPEQVICDPYACVTLPDDTDICVSQHLGQITYLQELYIEAAVAAR